MLALHISIEINFQMEVRLNGNTAPGLYTRKYSTFHFVTVSGSCTHPHIIIIWQHNSSLSELRMMNDNAWWFSENNVVSINSRTVFLYYYSYTK